MRNRDTLYLDIRTPEEACTGYHPGAFLINTPLPPLGNDDIHRLEKRMWVIVKNYPLNTPIRVYCKKGIRSEYAKYILEDWGYTNVVSLGGVETNPELRKALVLPACRCRHKT